MEMHDFFLLYGRESFPPFVFPANRRLISRGLFLVTKDIFVLNGLSLSYNNEATDEQSIMVTVTAFGKK